MELKLHRRYKGENYTIGDLYVNGEWFCNTLEDKDRGLNDKMSLWSIEQIKVKDQTAIPTGTYKVTLSVQSPKYKTRKQYEFCNGYLPRLLNVIGFEGILIHIGNKAGDSSGCILVGENKVKGQVINSTATFKKLYERLKSATDEITIEIY
jgi:hypothetical protein